MGARGWNSLPALQRTRVGFFADDLLPMAFGGEEEEVAVGLDLGGARIKSPA